MADMLEECLADLGTRRAPLIWASIAQPCVERAAVKQQRRKNLTSGAAYQQNSGLPRYNRRNRSAKHNSTTTNTQSTKDPVAAPPEEIQLLSIRRRDYDGQRSVARAIKEAAIQQCLAMKAEPIDPTLPWLEQESETGHVEYKYKLNNPHPIRLQQLITQLKFRLAEGGGQCFYYLGVEDDGYPKGLAGPELDGSIANLHNMANTLGAHATLVRIFPGAHGRRCALLRVQRGLAQELSYVDLRIAVAGCVDSGKSTLVAVLTHGSNGSPCLDTGRGTARMAVLKHKHEIESGRTSSLSHQFLGYDSQGKVLNYASTSATKLTEMCSAAASLLTFIDMGGHEKCLKTALYGLTALLPDYALLCCCAVGGLGHVSREHLAVAVALQIPVAVVITKADLVDAVGLAKVVQDIRQLVGVAWPAYLAPAAAGNDAVQTSAIEGATPVVTEADAALGAASMLRQMGIARQDSQVPGQTTSPGIASSPAAPQPFVLPIIPVSCVTGTGIDVLHAFLNALKPYQPEYLASTLPATVTASAPDLTALNGDGSTQLPTALSATASIAATITSQPPAGDVEGSVPQSDMNAQALSNTMADESTNVSSTAADAVAVSPAMELTNVPDDSQQTTVHFQVDHLFEVAGVGSVVSGRALSGCIRLGHTLLLGPTVSGGFVEVQITSIQRAHIPVQQIRSGQCATLALSPIEHSNNAASLNGKGKLDDAAAAIQAAAAAGGAAIRCPARGNNHRSNARLEEEPDLQGCSSDDADDEAYCNTSNRHSKDDSRSKGAVSAGNNSPGKTYKSEKLHSLHGRGDRGIQSGNQEQVEENTNNSMLTATHKPPPLISSLQPQPSHEAASAQPHDPASAMGNSNVPMATTADTLDVADELLELFDMDDENDQAEMPSSDVALQTTKPAVSTAKQDSGLELSDLFMESAQSAPSHRASSRHERINKSTNDSNKVNAGSKSASITAASAWPDVDEQPDLKKLHELQRVVRRDTWKPQTISAGWHDPVSGNCYDTGLFHGSTSYVEGNERPMPYQQAASPPLPSALLCSSPSSMSHRGAVLLCPALQPRTVWGFEAVLILLSGTWPPRGLVSGCWPPVDEPGNAEDVNNYSRASSVQKTRRSEGPGTGTDSDVHCWGYSASNSYSDFDSLLFRQTRRSSASNYKDVDGETGVEQGLRAVSPPVDTIPEHGSHQSSFKRRSNTRPPAYTCVVHCANVRQQARLIKMQEISDVPDCEPLSNSKPPALMMPPSMRAAAALLHAPAQPASDVLPARLSAELSQEQTLSIDPAGATPDLGCIVTATFRFEHRPEWLCQGAALVVRDRSTGHVSGAGYIRCMVP